MVDTDHDVLADWSRLGVLWNVPASRRTPDVERLIVDSFTAIRHNPRMLVLLSSWLSVFWRCVGRDRLTRLASTAAAEEHATLGIVLETTDSWLATPVFTAAAKRLAPVVPPRPLFDADRCRPALARLAEYEASPVSRRWGLWCLPVQRKPGAIRPAAWVLDTNPTLKARALFKGSLKTSLLATIDAAGTRPVSPTELARQCGVTRKAVYEALDDLRFAGLVPHTGEPDGERARGHTWPATL